MTALGCRRRGIWTSEWLGLVRRMRGEMLLPRGLFPVSFVAGVPAQPKSASVDGREVRGSTAGLAVKRQKVVLRLRQAASASSSQPARNSTPPSGVIAPKPRTPVSVSR